MDDPLPSETPRDHSAAAPGRNAKRPITVLQVLPRLDLGGVERGALEIARAVVEAGGRALVASAGGRLGLRMEGFGAELIEGPYSSKNPVTILRNAGALAEIVRAEAVDIVHARSRAPAWSAWLAARRTGTPFVTTWHGVYGEREPFKRLYNSVMGKGRPVIAISQFIAELAQERYGVPTSAIEIIPRGADLAQFTEESVGAERAIALARAWGVVEDPRPIALLPGRLGSSWKGQDVFVAAAARLKARRGADFIALIVGDDGGGAGERLVEAARAQDALDVVRVAPACEDMPAAYKLSAVVVSASTAPEAFGRVAVEAQAMGRPVVATDHGGARETVAPGETGWLCPPGDAAALADALDAALSLDPGGAGGDGRAGPGARRGPLHRGGDAGGDAADL
jgi:glycosyltransferase involved in cell wall biosynthesis